MKYLRGMQENFFSAMECIKTFKLATLKELEQRHLGTSRVDEDKFKGSLIKFKTSIFTNGKGLKIYRQNIEI